MSLRETRESSFSAASQFTSFFLRPKFIFTLVCLANLLNYIDRGIIPGSTNEINSFIKRTVDTNTPDVFLGLLQSAFIIGFMGGSLVFGHLIHTYGRFTLTGIGCGIWIVAVMLSGSAYYANSFVFLLFARVLSGIAEASMQCAVPPWIQKVAPLHQKGLWLGFFYMAIPVGTAIGYAYSSLVSESIGWQFAFFIEGFVMIPFVCYMFIISPHFPPDKHSADEDGQHPTVYQEFLVVCGRPVFLCISLAYAAQSAVLMGLSTFGSAFMMGLGYFDTESEASTLFGVVISLAGMISTPLGGVILDKLLADHRSQASEAQARSTSIVEEVLEEIDEQQLHQLAPLVADSEASLPAGEVYSEKRVKTLKTIVLYIGILNVVGGAVTALVFFSYSKGLFLFLVAVGCSLIFMSTSGITMGVMLSVPLTSQSFAIAVNNVCLHGFGDVPSPVIVGLIKDTLAPGCIAKEDDDGNIAASQDCRDDGQGIRLTMLLTTLWIIWAIFFFFLAWFLLKWRYHLLPFGVVDYRDVDPDESSSAHKLCDETAMTKEGSQNILWQGKVVTGAGDDSPNDRSFDRYGGSNRQSGPDDASETDQLLELEKENRSQQDHSNRSPSLARSTSGDGHQKSRILSAEEANNASTSEKLRNLENLKRLSREKDLASRGNSSESSSSKFLRKGIYSKDALKTRFREMEDSIDI